MNTWIPVCDADEIESEDVIRFDHQDKTYAVYRSDKDTYHATDGLCTHGNAHLADGFVMGCEIECPKHNGRFDITCGKATRKPARSDLATYPVRLLNGKVEIQLPQ